MRVTAADLVMNALNAPYATRERLLRSVLIDIRESGLPIETPRAEPASPTRRLALQFCTWALNHHMLTPSCSESLPVLKLANKIGHPHVAKILIEETNWNTTKGQHDDIRFEFLLSAAKSFRLLGDHARAMRVYSDLLQETATSEHGNSYYAPKLLLNLGKMSHSYHWRTGLYLQLARIAARRFQSLLQTDTAHRSEVRRQIAICIDCICHTELTIVKSVDARALFRRWEEALDFCPVNSLSYWRVRMRRTYAMFQRAEDEALRSQLIEEYSKGVTETEGHLDERRGLAVRYGQLAEMLSEAGRVEEAFDYLGAAVEFSRLVSDWRVLAGNAIRSSVLHMRHNRGIQVDMLVMSLDQLRKFNAEVPIDVEVALLRQLARQHLTQGNSARAKHCLDEVVEKLESFDRRILVESVDADVEPDELSIRRVLAAVLPPDELATIREAGMVDYAILSRVERSVINELLETVSSDARKLGSKQQVSMSRLAVSTVLHDQKRRIEDLLVELRGGVDSQFANEVEFRQRMLRLVADAESRVRREFNAGLEIFAPNAMQLGNRVRPVSVSSAFAKAIERGRFVTRYPDIRFRVPISESGDFLIAVDADLLITVLDNLIQNAATAAFTSSGKERYVDVAWSWSDDIEHFCAKGVLTVTDSAGGVDQLRRALVEGTEGRFGLSLAKMFFYTLGGTLSASGIPGAHTTLRIEIEASEIVRRLVK